MLLNDSRKDMWSGGQGAQPYTPTIQVRISLTHIKRYHVYLCNVPIAFCCIIESFTHVVYGCGCRHPLTFKISFWKAEMRERSRTLFLDRILRLFDRGREFKISWKNVGENSVKRKKEKKDLTNFCHVRYLTLCIQFWMKSQCPKKRAKWGTR